MTQKRISKFGTFRASREYGTPDGFSPSLPFQLFKTPPFGQGVPVLPTANAPVLDPAGLGDPMGVMSPAVLAKWARVFLPTQYSDFVSVPITVGLADSIILPASDTIRTFLLLINIDAAATIRIAFGTQATAVNGIPLAPIPAGGVVGGSFLLDAEVAQNDIHAVASAAPASLVLVYGSKVIA